MKTVDSRSRDEGPRCAGRSRGWPRRCAPRISKECPAKRPTWTEATGHRPHPEQCLTQELTGSEGIHFIRCVRREQGAGLLQIGGVESLGEPVVRLLQEPMGGHVLASPPPQAGQTHRGPELQRPCPLAPRDREGLLEALLSVRGALPLRPGCPGRHLHDQIALEPVEPGFPPALTGAFDLRQCFIDDLDPARGLSHRPVRCGHGRQVARPQQGSAFRAPRVQDRSHLSYPFLAAPSLNERPPLLHGALGSPVREVESSTGRSKRPPAARWPEARGAR
jgi:hypothetical protein